ncbi:MAG TPA: hypothetical protein VKB57_12865, partial [Acidimicrobiales bacterium]|nr:hypothetical protein [Acidimicrobiales bacterium]
LDSRLADEPQLRLAPRAAIRPITQPPPVIDDRNLASSLAAAESARPRHRARSSRGVIVLGVMLALVVLVVLAVLGEPDDTATTTESTTNTSAGREPTTGGHPAATTAPPTTAAPGNVEPGASLRPTGVGPLRIGATLGQLQAAGVAIQPDQSTYNGTGGRCYNAPVIGALDLRLRFVPPPGQNRAADPTQGVLAAIDIRADADRPSSRVSNTGIGLGANQLQILAAYKGNLDQRDDPFYPGGKIFRAAVGNGLGVAYDTDGQNVIGIAVGDMEVIKFVNNCG